MKHQSSPDLVQVGGIQDANGGQAIEGPAGLEEQQLGFRHKTLAFFIVLQQMTNLFADGRTTGLARIDDRVSLTAKTIGQLRSLRGLATAFRTLECNK